MKKFTFLILLSLFPFHLLYGYSPFIPKEYISCEMDRSELVAYNGILARHSAIGGESSGLALRIPKREGGRFQMYLLEVEGQNPRDHELLFQMLGQALRIEGYKLFRYGLERGLYSVFKVCNVYEVRDLPAPEPIPDPRPTY